MEFQVGIQSRFWAECLAWTMVCCVQVVNRDKLQRAGEDNLFVRLLYAKDTAQKPRNQDEQERLGKQVMTDSLHFV